MNNMNALETAIEQAISAKGNTKEANKAYLEFIKANFIIPIERSSNASEPEVLFLVEDTQVFLPVFTNMSYFQKWAAEIENDIQLLKLSAVDLLKGLADDVIICLNIGSASYKEFNPAELARMRSMVLKIMG